MKKTILCLLAALTFVGASAIDLGPKRIKGQLPANMVQLPVEANALHKAPARAAEGEDPGEANDQLSMNYSPAYDPYSAIRFEESPIGSKYGQAFQFTSDMSTSFAGNNITRISFYTGVNASSNTNEVKKATVFIANDIDQDPIITKKVDLPATRFQQIFVDLDEPFAIEAGKSFFVGVICAVGSVNDLPLVIDGMYHGADDCGGWIGYQGPKEETMSWNNYASQVGFVTVGVTIAGDHLPTNTASIEESFVAPVVTANKDFELDILLRNNASNLVENVDVEVKLGDGEPRTYNIAFDEEDAFGYNAAGILVIDDLEYAQPTKELALTATITKVNGEPNKSTNNVLTTTISVVDPAKSFARRAVIEEFTGIWCGYCPMGYVAMEYIHENDNDGNLIPVTVHVEDALEAASFSKLVSQFADGVPAAIINRWYSSSPSLEEGLVEDAEFVCSIPAIGNVTATATLDKAKKQFVVETETEFTFDYDGETAPFLLAYAITEDNVGPYEQHSYFTEAGECPGWDYTDEYVTVYYNDVARVLDRYSGVANSVPAQITAGQKYTFSHNVKSSISVSNIDNCNLVVYLLNTATGVIENACSIKKGDIAAGIEDITIDSTDANAPVEYFNLQGMRVAEPAAGGLYIRRQGTNVVKTIVK